MDFRKRFPLRLWRPAVDDEVDGELEFHLEMRRRQYLAQGMSEAQARQAALDKFGNYSRARRQCRALGRRREQRMRLLQYSSELWQDAAFALRQLLRAPAFSALAIVTLAVGIGATTAIFSAVHAVVLRPLAITEPDRVVTINSGWRGGLMAMAPAHYLHLAEEQKAFQSIAAMQWASFTLTRADGAERVIGARVTGSFWNVFGVRPALGAVFGVQEDAPGRDQVVVLSHDLWTSQFGSDPRIIGRDITLNMRPHTVVAVMPPSFDVTGQTQALWVPMAFTPDTAARRGNHYLTVYARLLDGMSVSKAEEQMPLIVSRRVERWPSESEGRTILVRPVMESLVGDYRERLFVLFAAVGLVLLIACGNVSNLLLARGATRARELALRSALGAGQGRLVRQLFTESLMLGVVSAAAGVMVARGLIGLLVAYGPSQVPRLDQAQLDWTVFGFAVALALAASILFGLLPSWRVSRTDVNSMLKEAGRGAGARGSRDLVRSSLIAVEVALALILLVGAALLIRTTIEMQRVQPGFDAAGVFTGRVTLGSRHATPEALLQVTQELESRIAAIPGVDAAAVASAVPGARGFSNGLLPEGKALHLENITQTDGVIISPAYFSAMRLPVVRGRAFTDADRGGAMLVVMINRTAAQMMWPGEDALGKRLTSANPLGPTTVIGIVEDVRLGGPSEPAPPTFYVPFAQMNDEAWAGARAPFIIARTSGAPAALAPAVRRIVDDIDRTMPLYSTATMDERMASTVETARFNTSLLVMLGAAGVLLAAVGIYGVIAYFATQRTSEMCIRMALGASRRNVLLLVIGQAMIPVGAGVVLGAIGAAFASQAIAAQLVGVDRTDPLTFIAVTATLVAVALLAAIIPARRAASLDPMRALRS